MSASTAPQRDPSSSPGPLVVGISGSLREGSYTYAATQLALEGARQAGARTEMLCLRDMRLPFRDAGEALPDDAREAVGRHAWPEMDDAELFGWVGDPTAPSS